MNVPSFLSSVRIAVIVPLCFAVAVCIGSASVSAGLILSYAPNETVDGTAPSQVFSAGIMANPLTAIGLTYRRGSGTLAYQGFSTGAATPGQFITFGYESTLPIDLGTLDIAFSSALGPEVVDIFASFDGASFENLLSLSTPFRLDPYMPRIDLTARTARSAEFRLIGSQAARSDGVFGFSPLAGSTPAATIQLTGAIAAVPEPAALTTLILIAGCFYSQRKRAERRRVTPY
ncbi:hypothetical protein [Allorhodopirellula heiligendammensis]|uniref:PEP-CTERM protein-sorting domain-containing protein n=1 Tax=Allorhodopirellula heiligendammensis TaxID=2714739 RepID=A0A5C6BWK6_9BACT|nr:hypothetical protein [Allorhodopirellula heiligendammensis]TWU15164.1 hypothetical protein Poly21_23560 [Allorhodopirellula heiligendammensis]